MGDDSTRLRQQLVADLERRNVIQSQRVHEAFLAVRRELFVPEFAGREGLDAVYSDDAIPTKHNRQGIPLSSSSQPAIMAPMLEHLELEEGMRVLEVGAGTGYNAALLSLIVGKRGQVVSVDIDPQIAAEARRALGENGYRVRTVHADGRSGFAQRAPYDRIIVTASADTVPRAWFEQLADDGLLEAPLRLNAAGMQAIPVLRKTPRGFRSLRVLRGGFMPLRDEDDDGTPLPPKHGLNVTEFGAAGPGAILHLGGAALATLSKRAKRRLLATAMGEPRRVGLGVRAEYAGLSFYLSLTLPRSTFVTSFPPVAIGTIGRDGGSLAVIEAVPASRRKVDSLKLYGGEEAAEVLLERVGEWARRGCPAESDATITVNYVENGSRLAVHWPPRARTSRDTRKLRTEAAN